jgi:hypothetical protein
MNPDPDLPPRAFCRQSKGWGLIVCGSGISWVDPAFDRFRQPGPVTFAGHFLCNRWKESWNEEYDLSELREADASKCA